MVHPPRLDASGQEGRNKLGLRELDQRIRRLMGQLSDVTDDVGIIKAGRLETADGSAYLDLNAVSADPILLTPLLRLIADGRAVFGDPADDFIEVTPTAIIFHIGGIPEARVRLDGGDLIIEAIGQESGGTALEESLRLTDRGGAIGPNVASSAAVEPWSSTSPHTNGPRVVSTKNVWDFIMDLQQHKNWHITLDKPEATDASDAVNRTIFLHMLNGIPGELYFVTFEPIEWTQPGGGLLNVEWGAYILNADGTAVPDITQTSVAVGERSVFLIECVGNDNYRMISAIEGITVDRTWGVEVKHKTSGQVFEPGGTPIPYSIGDDIATKQGGLRLTYFDDRGLDGKFAAVITNASLAGLVEAEFALALSAPNTFTDPASSDFTQPATCRITMTIENELGQVREEVYTLKVGAGSSDDGSGGSEPPGPGSSTIVPNADVSSSGFTTAPLFSKVNDGSSVTEIVGATATGPAGSAVSTARFALEDADHPSTNVGWKVRVEGIRVDTGGGGGATLIVRGYHAGTLVFSRNVTMLTARTVHAWTLTESEAVQILDVDNFELEVAVNAFAPESGATVTPKISQVEVEIPA